LSPAPMPLSDRRLVIVTGKGGTGKTTVAAALALGAAAAGRRTLVATVSPDARLGPLLAAGAGPVEYAPRELRPGVSASHVEPFEALGEYLGLQLGGRRWIDPILRQKAFRQLLTASPGWRELITLGKIWHLEQQRAGGRRLYDPILRQKAFRQLLTASPGWRELITLGKIWHLEQQRAGARRLYDLIVVDAPATGHGLTFLDVPRVVVSAVRTGPLRHHTEQVEALIEDRERTLLLPVALAEELPARETIELVSRAREKLGIGLDRVVVNAIHAPPYPDALADLDERLAALPSDLDLGTLPAPPVLAACGATLRSRARLNARYTEEIGRETGLPVVALPYLRDGVRGPADVERLAEPLLARPAEAA